MQGMRRNRKGEAEYLVLDINACVNDVRAGAFAGGLVVDVGGVALLTVRDAGKAPGYI